ncbi:MAG: hypothetical protein HGB12_08455 [Bacteroidetes bacterium]|nr:hypothetical protein [Bacteroidota bacterium]
MHIIRLYTSILLLLSLPGFSQNDSVKTIKYNRDFVFNDGVYKTFQEFKNNSPSIKKFSVKKASPLSDPNYTLIEYSDTIADKNKLKDCWGYCYHGNVYIAHPYYAYYFKLMVIGSLCHYYGISEILSSNAFGNNMVTGISFDKDYGQFMLDFKTGITQIFNYKTFLNFIKTNDDELYQELIVQKKKRQIIYMYLLKYNERHPIWFKEK